MSVSAHVLDHAEMQQRPSRFIDGHQTSRSSGLLMLALVESKNCFVTSACLSAVNIVQLG
jgi:hypothetical protein